MFIPFLSSPSEERQKLWRRKGGGGGGRGSSSSGSSKSSSSSSSSKSSSSSSSGKVSSGSSSIFKSSSSSSSSSSKSSSNSKAIWKMSIGSSSSKSTTVKSYGGGVAAVSTIPAGAAFAGRSVGGGTRGQIYGSRTYGSGYPGLSGNRGVGGLGFPFFFWPVAFVGGAAVAHHYHDDIYNNDEYGDASNSTRPGGAQKVAAFTSASETFRLLADSESVDSLVETIKEECKYALTSTTIPVETYDGSNVEPPRPEQVIQYYRASTIALSLDSYNNSALFRANETSDSPINTGATALMTCLNETIGEAAPLVDAAGSISSPSTLVLFWVAGLVAVLGAQF